MDFTLLSDSHLFIIPTFSAAEGLAPAGEQSCAFKIRGERGNSREEGRWSPWGRGTQDLCHPEINISKLIFTSWSHGPTLLNACYIQEWVNRTRSGLDIHFNEPN